MQLDPSNSCVSAPLPTNVDLFGCFAEGLKIIIVYPPTSGGVNFRTTGLALIG